MTVFLLAFMLTYLAISFYEPEVKDQTVVYPEPKRNVYFSPAASVDQKTTDKFVSMALKKVEADKTLSTLDLWNMAKCRYQHIQATLEQNEDKKPEVIRIEGFMNAQYYGEVSVGNPKQIFRVIPDTGSPFFWVLSQDCTKFGCRVHRRYDNKKSSTARPTSEKFEIKYGSGEVSGTWTTDDVFLGSKKVPDYNFLEVKDQDGLSWVFMRPDCIMGFSYNFEGKGAPNRPTFFSRLIELDLVEQPVFSVMLEGANEDGTGELLLGGFVEEYYCGELMPLEVIRPLYWEVLFNGAQVGDQLVKATTAILDTGTSLIVIPKAAAESINALIGAGPQKNGVFTIDKNKISSLPPIRLFFKGATLEFLPQDYVVEMGMGPFKQAISAFAYMEGMNLSQWIFGAPLLRAFYTVHDMKNKTLHIAPAVRKGKSK